MGGSVDSEVGMDDDERLGDSDVDDIPAFDPDQAATVSVSDEPVGVSATVAR